MKNYWLDKKSERQRSEDRWKRVELLSTNASAIFKDRFRKVASTYKLELSQQGRIVLPLYSARCAIKGDIFTVRLQDNGNFPLKTYRWLAENYDWGRKSGPVFDGVLKKYVGRKQVLEKGFVFSLRKMEVDINDRTEGVELVLSFQVVK